MAHAAGLRTNTDFQLQFFIEGSAHTWDGKWSLLWMQWNVYQQKVDNIPANHLKREGMRLKLEWTIEHAETPWDRLNAQAELHELEVGLRHWDISEDAWKAELEFTKMRMEVIGEKCLYSDLPLLARHEAAQRDEWLCDLMYKSENFIISTGVIPHDYLDAMRMHPDFRLKLLPYLNDLCSLRTNLGGHPAGMLHKLPTLIGGPRSIAGTSETEKVITNGMDREDVKTVLSIRQTH